MSDYSTAVKAAESSSVHVQGGGQPGTRSAPITSPVALGPYGPTRAPQPPLTQDQGGSAAQPSGAADPGDVGGDVGPTGPATLVQGAAEAQQHSEPGGGTLPAVSQVKRYGPQA